MKRLARSLTSRTTLALGVILLPFAAAGCNTVSGVGKDISAGGQAITTASTNVQESLWN